MFEEMTIKKSLALDVLLVCIMIEPMSISKTIPLLSTVWENLRYAVFVLFILRMIYVVIRKLRVVNPLFGVICIFYLWQLITTYYNISVSGTGYYEGSVYAVVAEAFTAIGIASVMTYMLEKDYHSAVRALALVVGLYSVINFATIVIYPGGYYHVGNETSKYAGYFLGDKNNHITVTMIGSVACLASSLLEKNKIRIRAWLVLLLNFLSALLAGTFTTLYALTFLIVGAVLIAIDKEFEAPFKKIFCGSVGFCGVIVFFGATNIIGNLINLVTTRTITFYTRFITWGKAFELIKNHLIIGNGYINKEKLLSLIGGSHAHNYYIECLLRGGLILLFILFYMLYVSFHNCDMKLKTSNYFEKMSELFAFSMGAIMLASIFEAYLNFRYFIVVFYLSFFFLNYYETVPCRKQKMRRLPL